MKANLKIYRKILLTLFGVLTLSILFLVTSCEDDNEITQEVQLMSISETVKSKSELSSFANLFNNTEQFLALSSNAGPYTLFAPTNAAFAKLDPRLIDKIKQDPDQLHALLTNHIVQGKFEGKSFVNVMQLSALSGSILDVGVFDESLILNNSAELIETDVIASNGLIHIVDGVILPDYLQTLGYNLEADPGISIFAQLLSKPEMSALLAKLNDPTEVYTVFVPTNDAFNNYLKSNGMNSIDEIPQRVLEQILYYHIMKGSLILLDYGFSDLDSFDSPTLLPGENLNFRWVPGNIEGNLMLVNNAEFIGGKSAINGNITFINAVLIPKALVKNELIKH